MGINYLAEPVAIGQRLMVLN